MGAIPFFIMIAGMKTPAAAVFLLFSASAFAQDMPVPKMFKGMQGQKGQYQVEFLEGGGRAGKAAPAYHLAKLAIKLLNN